MKLVNTVKLAPAIASTNGAHFMLEEPAHKMVRVTSMFAAHAPGKPLGKREVGQ
jgi:hypothetical protein